MKTILENLDSGWIELNSIIQYRKVNEIVYVTIINAGSVSCSSGVWTTLGTLPTGFRPTVDINFTYDYMGGIMPGNTTSKIKSSGEINFFAGNTATSYLRGSIAFPAD